MNEEILVAIPDGNIFSDYYDAIWNKSKNIDDFDEIKINSLINFFRLGRLYFKPTTSFSTSINPFKDLLKFIPDEELSKITNLPDIPYADIESGIGPFNLKRIFGFNELDEDEVTQNTRVSIKPYSIETCFGYWVPDAYDSHWQEKLEDANKQKRIKWNEFKEKFLFSSKNEIHKNYNKYVKGIMLHLVQIENLDKYVRGYLGDEDDLKGRLSDVIENEFNNFYDRTKRFLENKDRFERLVNSYVSGPIPEMWEDKLAYNEFCMSFFDYLRNEFTSNRKNNISKSIFNQIETEDINKIEVNFKKYLKNKGWKQECWLKLN